MDKKSNGHDVNKPYGDRLVAYTPFITKMANHYCRLHPANGDPADFIQDVFLIGMQRRDNYDPKYTFGTWVLYLCRIIADRQKKRRMTAAGSAKHVELNAERGEALPASQHDYTELSQVLSRLSGRGGEILLRTSMGEDLNELGSDLGISKERVRQLKNVARDNLVKSLNNVRRAA